MEGRRLSGSVTHGPFPVACRLSPPDRAPGLHHLSTLQWGWRDGRAPGAPVSSSWPGRKRHLAGRSIQHGPTTPLGVPGADWGGDPPPDREWKRERRLSWFGWLVTYWDGLPAHPGINWARRRVTSLIRRNALLLCHATNLLDCCFFSLPKSSCKQLCDLSGYCCCDVVTSSWLPEPGCKLNVLQVTRKQLTKFAS